MNLSARIADLAAADHRYTPEAYHFVFQALDFVLEREEGDGRAEGRTLSADRHIAATDLLSGLRDFALAQYGPLARLVLERWGIRSTEDFGEIVFGLVDCQLLNKQETDRKSDFCGGFDFEEAFDRAWRPKGRARRVVSKAV